MYEEYKKFKKGDIVKGNYISSSKYAHMNDKLFTVKESNKTMFYEFITLEGIPNNEIGNGLLSAYFKHATPEEIRKYKIENLKWEDDMPSDIDNRYILIKIYSGISVEHKCRQQLHPLNEVNAAKKLIMAKRSIECYSNSPDFISTIKYMAEKVGIEVEFHLDGVSVGNNIEPIFEDFNRAFDKMDVICK